MSCIDLYIIEKVYPAKFFSIHCVNTGGLKLNFEKGNSHPMFSTTSATSLVSAHCTVTSTDEYISDYSQSSAVLSYIVSRAVKRDFGEPSKKRQVSSSY